MSSCFLAGASRNTAIGARHTNNMTPENGLRVRLHPGRKTIPYGRDIFLITRKDLAKGVRQNCHSGKGAILASDGQSGEIEFSRAAEHPEIPRIQCSLGYMYTSMMVRQRNQHASH